MAESKKLSDFDIDLSYGVIREGAFANILFQATVEIKSDRKAIETGNVAIEYSQQGRPSGIAISKAFWYAIEFAENRWILIRTEDLKGIARRIYQEEPNRRKLCGDNNNECVLVPISELTKPWGVIQGRK